MNEVSLYFVFELIFVPFVYSNSTFDSVINWLRLLNSRLSEKAIRLLLVKALSSKKTFCTWIQRISILILDNLEGFLSQKIYTK